MEPQGGGVGGNQSHNTIQGKTQYYMESQMKCGQCVDGNL